LASRGRETNTAVLEQRLHYDAFFTGLGPPRVNLL